MKKKRLITPILGVNAKSYMWGLDLDKISFITLTIRIPVGPFIATMFAVF